MSITKMTYRPVLSRGETIDSCCSEDLDLVTVLEVRFHNFPGLVITFYTFKLRFQRCQLPKTYKACLAQNQLFPIKKFPILFHKEYLSLPPTSQISWYYFKRCPQPSLLGGGRWEATNWREIVGRKRQLDNPGTNLSRSTNTKSVLLSNLFWYFMNPLRPLYLLFHSAKIILSCGEKPVYPD